VCRGVGRGGRVGVSVGEKGVIVGGKCG